MTAAPALAEGTVEPTDAAMAFARMPEQVWDSLSRYKFMQASRYLRAARLLERDFASALATKATNTTSISSGGSGSDASRSGSVGSSSSSRAQLRRFVAQQAETMAQFDTLIAARCRRRLATRGLQQSDYADALCALALHSSASLEDVLGVFLGSRLSWVRGSLQACVKVLAARPDASAVRPATHALASVALAVQSTLSHAAALFATPTDTGSDSSGSGGTEVSLAAMLREFAQSSSTHNSSSTARRFAALPPSTLQRRCDAFLTQCGDLASDLLPAIWSRLLKGEHIATARDAVLACLGGEVQEARTLALEQERAQREARLKEQQRLREESGSGSGQLADGSEDTQALLTRSALEQGLGGLEEWRRHRSRAGGEHRSSRSNSSSSTSGGCSGDDAAWSGRAGSSLSGGSVGMSVGGRPETDRQRALRLQEEKTRASQRARQRRETWRQTCLAALGRPVALWDALFHASFAQRCHGAIETAFQAVELLPLLQRGLAHLEPLPTEHESGVAVAVSVSEDDESLAGLDGLLPTETSRAVATFEAQLEGLTAHIRALLACRFVRVPMNPVDPEAEARATADSAQFSSLRNLLRDTLGPLVQRCCADAVTRLSHALREKLHALQTELMEVTDHTSGASAVNQAAFVGRVCARAADSSQALWHLSTLDYAMLRESDGAADSSKQQPHQPHQPPQADFVGRALRDSASLGTRVWAHAAVSAAADSYAGDLRLWLRQWGDDPTLRQAWPRPEASQSLPLPHHASPHVTHAIFGLLREVQRVYGYAPPPSVLASVLSDAGTLMLQRTQALLDAPAEFGNSSSNNSASSNRSTLKALCEPAVLQLLFDLHFALWVLRLPSDGDGGSGGGARTTLFEPIVRQLERGSSLDPIDYAVSRDVLRALVRENVRRCGLLLGHFVLLNPLPAMEARQAKSTAYASVASDDVSNVMQLAAPVSRAPLLPTALLPAKAGTKAATASAQDTRVLPGGLLVAQPASAAATAAPSKVAGSSMASKFSFNSSSLSSFLSPTAVGGLGSVGSSLASATGKWSEQASSYFKNQ